MYLKRAVEVGFLLLILGLTALIFINKNNIVDLLNQYKLLPRPETFTELYIEDHDKLPSTLRPEKVYFFRFTTHNLEHKPMDYNYEVKAIASDSATLLDKGNFSLNHDAYKTIRGEFESAEITGRTQIQIRLVNKNQSIHFWVEAPPEPIEDTNEQ